MNAHNIILGGVVVPFDAAHTLTQDYEEIGGRILRRTLDGTGILQRNWGKVRTIIAGSGSRPEGLSGLDYTASMSLSCAAPLSKWSASNVITLPASRRTDVLTYGYAVVDGAHIRTPVSVASNTATLTTVSGADGYVVTWFPVLTVYAQPPALRFDARGVVLGWQITAEEV